MAKIDTKQIEGFDEMSPEQKIAALLDVDVSTPEPAENGKLKQAFDRASSEAAEWKRKYRETQSEQERMAAEIAEQNAQRDAELAALKEEKRLATYTQKLMGAGYDQATAEVMAKSMKDGVEDGFFDSQKRFLEEQKKAAQAAYMNGQPPLASGTTPSSQTIEDKTFADIRRAALGHK